MTDVTEDIRLKRGQVLAAEIVAQAVRQVYRKAPSAPATKQVLALVQRDMAQAFNYSAYQLTVRVMIETLRAACVGCGGLAEHMLLAGKEDAAGGVLQVAAELSERADKIAERNADAVPSVVVPDDTPGPTGLVLAKGD